MATHSTILAWRIPRTEGPDGLQPIGSQRVGHDRILHSTKLLSAEMSGLWDSNPKLWLFPWLSQTHSLSWMLTQPDSWAPWALWAGLGEVGWGPDRPLCPLAQPLTIPLMAPCLRAHVWVGVCDVAEDPRVDPCEDGV